MWFFYKYCCVKNGTLLRYTACCELTPCSLLRIYYQKQKPWMLAVFRANDERATSRWYFLNLLYTKYSSITVVMTVHFYVCTLHNMYKYMCAASLRKRRPSAAGSLPRTHSAGPVVSDLLSPNLFIAFASSSSG